jgi:dCMP deaminase
VSSRPSWDAYFLGIAEAVAARADCRRARFGSVIVDVHKRIVATGYNGAPPGGKSCLAGECPRGLKTYEETPGHHQGNHDYSDCISLHSEANAIANADHSRCRGGTIYIARLPGEPLPPCDMCGKLILAAGIARVVIRADS